MDEVSLYVSLLTDVIVSLAAMATAFFVWKGLSTWKEEFKSKTEYDLAKRVLASLYGYRNSIYYLILHYHLDAKRGFAEYEDFSNYYSSQMEKVSGARAELESNLLEAEAHWGYEVISIVNEIMVMEGELSTTLLARIREGHPLVSEEEKTKSRQILEENAWMLENGPTPENKFIRGVFDHVMKAEALVRPRMMKAI